MVGGYDEKGCEECDFGDVECEVQRLADSKIIRMMSDWSQALIKDRSVSWEMAEEVIEGQRCSCRATPGSCRCDLPTAEGRKGAAARGEGHDLYRCDRSVERSNLSTFKPTRCRDLSAAERRSARRQRFVARAGRRHLLCFSAPLGSRFARLGRFPMGRAHPQGAVTLLCVKNIYLSLPVLHG